MIVRPLKEIVTHPRKAHRDEFLACCVLLAYFGLRPITRRDPTPADLADPQIAVIDVGMERNEARFNFDHHQAPGLPCALHQVMEYLGLAELAREHYAWYELTGELDAEGAEAALKRRNLEASVARELGSPVELALLQQFATMGSIEPWFLQIMHLVGQETVGQLKLIAERLELLADDAQKVQVGRFAGLVTSFEEMPSLALAEYRRRAAPETVFTVSPEKAKKGWMVHRCVDGCGLDLAKLKGDPRVSFVHENGFLLKTRQRLPLAELLTMIASCG